ncbi:hypothetical protein BJF88_06345 [Cellulosimicrobium sp. CUA-896]|nr:hypothetical protein BJF88_06345 [Cellulosimicrobium sp. CUA-896]
MLPCLDQDRATNVLGIDERHGLPVHGRGPSLPPERVCDDDPPLVRRVHLDDDVVTVRVKLSHDCGRGPVEPLGIFRAVQHDGVVRGGGVRHDGDAVCGVGHHHIAGRPAHALQGRRALVDRRIPGVDDAEAVVHGEDGRECEHPVIGHAHVSRPGRGSALTCF